MANSVISILDSDADGDNDIPTGQMAEVKTLPNVTVTGTKKKSVLDSIFEGINNFSKVKLPTVQTGVDNDSIIKIGAVLIIVALIFTQGRKR